ncbi:MAG: RecQ family zinc-binding domain-containing protein, partial [Bacteroidota bacterium]
FRERVIADKLNISTGQLHQVFKKLVQDQIIEYQPQKDKPQLIYLKERVDADNLAIDLELYNFRKKRYLANIRAAIQYAEKPRCRSKQLLTYFGELEAPLCGVCDVCLGRTESDINEEEYERYKLKIKRLVQREKLTKAEVITSFGKKREELIEQVLTFLIDESFVDILEGQVVWRE